MQLPHRQQHSLGFTLIEMLVSLALFAVVVTMSVGSLLILIDANGKAQSTQLVVTNLSFALDSMTREMRTGFNWDCHNRVSESSPPIPGGNDTDDCPSGHNALSIVESGSSITGGSSSAGISITS